MVPFPATHKEYDPQMMKNSRRKTQAASELKSDRRGDPIAILMDEHERALRYTTILSKAAERIQKDGFSFDAYMEISDAINLIETEMKAHDKKEENFLFPLLAQRLPDQTNILYVEHRELWSAMSQLRIIVKDVADGNIHGMSIIELVKATRNVAELLRNHIQKENDVYFPQARKLLSIKQCRQLAKDFSKVH
jgi:hemerythrin-like domain-containing protein